MITPFLFYQNKRIFVAVSFNTLELAKKPQSVIALGTFDGVHLGHQKIIDRLLQEAKKLNATPIIVTFFPHPTHVLTPTNPLKMINSIDERLNLLRKKGVAKIEIKEFTNEFSKTAAIDFIQRDLLRKMNMQKLIIGHDHGFGKDKEGNYEALLNYADQLGFDLVKVDAYKKENLVVSSTLIRNLLLKGKIQKVNTYLGYTFCLYGTVVKGNQLGRKIGFNTANIVLDYPNKIVPKKGVYVVQSKIDKVLYYGMMNIGYRPTVNGQTQTIEIHFFDLKKNLYEKKMKVKLLYRLRDEYKFDSLIALKNQLIIDKQEALLYIGGL